MLMHPQKETQRRAFYPFRGTVQRVNTDPMNNDETAAAYVDVAELVDLPCAYVPAMGAAPGDFRQEGDASDRVLLQGAARGIEAGMKFVLRLDENETRFLHINDVLVLAGGTKTMLSVSPSM